MPVVSLGQQRSSSGGGGGALARDHPLPRLHSAPSHLNSLHYSYQSSRPSRPLYVQPDWLDQQSRRSSRGASIRFVPKKSTGGRTDHREALNRSLPLPLSLSREISSPREQSESDNACTLLSSRSTLACRALNLTPLLPATRLAAASSNHYGLQVTRD